VEFQ
jgi:hypothetical protein